MKTRSATILTSLAVLCMAGAAEAGTIRKHGPAAGQPYVISTSETWTSADVYLLQSQVYVLDGATLTIGAGTIIAGCGFDFVTTKDVVAGEGGGIAVARGGDIFINGTAANPVIMTSVRDVLTWQGTTSTLGVNAGEVDTLTPGNPKTGVWREAANEWGNLTIMGKAYISASVCKVGVQVPPITQFPNSTNFAFMEGLTPVVGDGGRTRYGGGDDNDDSGSISYVSIRYAGKVVGLGNELNGLSLGAIGRNTEISNVEIMNNVDDGIEIWGGTVNIDHFSIWNIGDDCFDVDQGWRGKAQFGLLVQGYSISGAQGGGVGDNIFESDGAEDSDQQPVTTSTIYNCTAIGMPDVPASGGVAGDHAMAFRANARVQFRNCIFMDIGERLVSADNTDNDNPCPDSGYGFNGTLSYANTWLTASTVTSTVFPFAAPEITPAMAYTVQTSGNLIEVKDSVMFNNGHGAAYTEANNRGVFNIANNNVGIAPSPLPTGSPITAIQRGATVIRNGFNMTPVIRLDPRPANDALASVASANPGEGFWTAANYRGAFAPGVDAWILGWTASYAFGLTPRPEVGAYFCLGDIAANCPCSNQGLPGNGCAGSAFSNGAHLAAHGSPSIASDTLTLTATNIPGPGQFFQSNGLFGGTGVTLGDGKLCAGVGIIRMGVVFPVTTAATYPGGITPNPIHIAGAPIFPGDLKYYQCWYRTNPALCNAAAPSGLTQGVQLTWQP